MSKPRHNPLRRSDCSGREALDYAVQHGCWARQGKGDHVVVGKGPVQTVVPLHRELRNGTRHAILKAFTLMGIALLALAFVGVTFLI